MCDPSRKPRKESKESLQAKEEYIDKVGKPIDPTVHVEELLGVDEENEMSGPSERCSLNVWVGSGTIARVTCRAPAASAQYSSKATFSRSPLLRHQSTSAFRRTCQFYREVRSGGGSV